MAGLLDPLTENQQRLVDLAAEAFSLDGEWPVFDYLEGAFDQEDKGAGETLATFPRVGHWNYGAAWWDGMGQMSKPRPDTEVALTLVGMHHSKALSQIVPIFFSVIDLMITRRQTTQLNRRKPRELSINDEDVNEHLRQERRLDTDGWSLIIFKLMAREPMLGSTASLQPDGHWTKSVPREIKEYQGVRTIEDYVACVERLTAFPQPIPTPAAPSPLDLVAALDYLDAVWRVAHGTRLFTYPSAERAAKLAYEANTPEELDARLSALGEILRSANASARATNAAKLPAATRDDPLAPFEEHLVRTADAAAEARVRQAATDLEHALALRDAAQHAEAGPRAVRALDAFGIGHPVADVRQAWMTVTARVVEALGAIREELASVSG